MVPPFIPPLRGRAQGRRNTTRTQGGCGTPRVVFIAGQFIISPSRIWCARMGVSLGLRSRLYAWPLSPTATGSGIVVGEVHHPVRAIESPTPNG